MYDTGDAWSDMRRAFDRRGAAAAGAAAAAAATARIKLKLMHFDGLQGAPSQIVSELAAEACMDGANYLFQANDDTLIVTRGWAATFAALLASNPLHPNLGVTGPRDGTNRNILTHAFV
ncbi:unnamed protein product, partial [Phaeothamnion confervicola]